MSAGTSIWFSKIAWQLSDSMRCKLVETVGGEAVEKYDQKVTCCCGALAFSEPEKSQAQIKKIIESAYDFGAEMIVTPARCAR